MFSLTNLIRPFALGHRQCPARNFAMYELRTLAAMILQQWEAYTKNVFSPFALSLPRDMYIQFTKRNSSR